MKSMHWSQKMKEKMRIFSSIQTNGEFDDFSSSFIFPEFNILGFLVSYWFIECLKINSTFISIVVYISQENVSFDRCKHIFHAL